MFPQFTPPRFIDWQKRLKRKMDGTHDIPDGFRKIRHTPPFNNVVEHGKTIQITLHGSDVAITKTIRTEVRVCPVRVIPTSTCVHHQISAVLATIIVAIVTV